MAKRRLNWREARAIMGCGKDKFYACIHLGLLPAYRVGKRGLWVYEEDVLRLVERVEPDAGEEADPGFCKGNVSVTQ